MRADANLAGSWDKQSSESSSFDVPNRYINVCKLNSTFELPLVDLHFDKLVG